MSERREIIMQRGTPSVPKGRVAKLAIPMASVFLALSVFAQDTITNVMSPVVSYQFYDALEHLDTNSVIMSPVASYQYFDWPGDDLLRLWSSPRVSYFYQGNDGPLILLQGRVTDTSGAPLSGVAVSVAFGSLPLAGTTTDANGDYTMPLGAGLYALTVSASGHAQSSRVLTLSVGTAAQNFQLATLPTGPPVVQTTRQPPTAFTQPPVGPMGSRLKVFDGSQFVAITADNAPLQDRMTIVLTHGWNIGLPDPAILGTPFSGWPSDMATQLRAHGITPAIANIVAWDWRYAATGLLPPEERTPSQGEALGDALQVAMKPNYAQPVHFIGFSLGTVVNAAAANYLHGDVTAQQRVSPAPWLSSRTHITLLDHAEISRIASAQVLFDGLTLNLSNPADVLKYAAKTLQGWKPSMPVQSAWADNYISLVGFYLPTTFNIALQKAEGIAALRAAGESSDPLVIAEKTLEYAHRYAVEWYSISIATPTAAPLGFQQSFEYDKTAGLPASTFPSALYQLGDAYHQTPSASDQLALEPLPLQNVFQLIVPLFGNGADVIVQGVVGTIKVAGEVASEIGDAAAQAGQWISQGFDYAGNAALQGGQTLVNLYNSAVLRLRFHTTPSALSPSRTPHQPPMAWLPIQFPSNATAMAFDFTVEGDPFDDVLVCGVGTNNLFSLEAKYIPTNTISASRLIDVSAWAGTTNELFFGFMGETSTNATLTIENIRFYSLAQPRLEISTSGNVSLLSWPSTAGGYVVETTPSLTSPAWEIATNAPVISADRYVLTNSWSDQSRFFRLRQR